MLTPEEVSTLSIPTIAIWWLPLPTLVVAHQYLHAIVEG
jgi:hypothetical protein